MKPRTLKAPAFALAGLTVAAMLGPIGCEDETTGELDLTPLSVRLRAAPVTNVSFVASGGDMPYTWTVENPSIGSLVSVGETAIYTSSAVTGRNFVTVMDAESNAVSATITQY